MSATEEQIEPGNAGLLLPDEPPPYVLVERPAARPALLVCDHASARIPALLGTLGLRPADLADHIALDIGAGSLARRLGELLGLPVEYSRLVVDCNRRLEDPTAFPKQVDGRIVPGNLELSSAARSLRAEEIYWPYHHAVRDRLQQLEALAPAPALIAVHTFTPVYAGRARRCHAGILWDKDPRIARPLIQALRAQPALVIGDNEPYSGRHPADFTIDHHAEAEGLPHVGIEVRQDQVSTAKDIERWAVLLSAALTPILDEHALYSHWSG